LARRPAVNRTFTGAARVKKGCWGQSVSAVAGAKPRSAGRKFSTFTVGKSSKCLINGDFQESGREFTRFQKKKQRKNSGPDFNGK
jgi:hypothetical protein